MEDRRHRRPEHLGQVDDTALTSQVERLHGRPQQVRALDDNGQWDKAVDDVDRPPSAKGPTGRSTTFDTAVTQARDDAGKAAVSNASRARPARRPLAALGVALAALLAPWLVVRGIGQRIEEYR